MLSDQRKEMLQQYKEGKLLQKMKDQREKAKRGIFKVGLYKPDPLQFLRAFPGQKTVKPEPKKAIQTSVGMAMSKAKDQKEQPKKTNQKEKHQLKKDLSAKIELKADKAKVLPSKVGRKEDLSKDPLTEETSHNSEKSAAEEIAAFLGKEHLFETSFASRVREKPSFAPENFVFQPLDSLMNYRMKPISPQKEHTYVKPSCFWSPLQIKADNSQELKRETLKESKTHCNTPVQQDLIDLQTPPRFQEILDKEESCPS